MSDATPPAAEPGEVENSASGAPRRRRVDPQRVRKLLAVIVLASQAPVLGFGALAAWGIFRLRDPHIASVYLWVGLGLTLLCLLAAGLLRRRGGFAVGWVVQILTVLSGFVLPPMFVVGLVFGGLWLTAIVQGRKMDALTADYLRRNPD